MIHPMVLIFQYVATPHDLRLLSPSACHEILFHQIIIALIVRLSFSLDNEASFTACKNYYEKKGIQMIYTSPELYLYLE